MTIFDEFYAQKAEAQDADINQWYAAQIVASEYTNQIPSKEDLDFYTDQVMAHKSKEYTAI